jgi:IS5 family transposase
MRQDRTVQASIFDVFAKHEIGGELKKASTWLDEHPTLLGRSQRTCAAMGCKRPDGTVCLLRRCCAARFSSNTAS